MAANLKNQVDAISRVLLEMATWRDPSYVRRNICMTSLSYREEFEVIAVDDNDDEPETLVHLIRKIENGTQETILAVGKHIFSITDYEKYEKKETTNLFPSDFELFGISLIENLGEWNKVAREILAGIKK